MAMAIQTPNGIHSTIIHSLMHTGQALGFAAIGQHEAEHRRESLGVACSLIGMVASAVSRINKTKGYGNE